MDIHPAIAFGSVIIFANLFGAVGAIVSVPIAAALVALLDTYSKRYELIPELVETDINRGSK
jgi:predicted PurR-regulated permease PerM